jgi:hypothetical protein
MEEFLANREWDDELEVDEEAQTVKLNTGLDLNGQDGRLIVEASEKTCFVDVFIYYTGFKCKPAKLNEMAVLLNQLHTRRRYGTFVAFDDGYVRWQHRVDFEDSEPCGLSIERIVGPGWEYAKQFSDPISAVALTKQSAKEALAEFDEARSANDDGPSEL